MSGLGPRARRRADVRRARQPPADRRAPARRRARRAPARRRRRAARTAPASSPTSSPPASRWVHVLHRAGKAGAGRGLHRRVRLGARARLRRRGRDGRRRQPRAGAAAAAARRRSSAPTSCSAAAGSPGGEVVDWPRSRELLSRGGNAWTRLALGLPLADATGGYRAYRREVLDALPLDEVASQGYCFQVDLAWQAWRAGFRVVEVPITFVERERGTSKMSRAIVLEALWRVTWWGLRSRRSRDRAAPRARCGEARRCCCWHCWSSRWSSSTSCCRSATCWARCRPWCCSCCVADRRRAAATRGPAQLAGLPRRHGGRPGPWRARSSTAPWCCWQGLCC